jgi:TrmH family RNA methyltransferase
MSMHPLEAVRVVLVSPIYGGNVGSVCRAMMNMGLRELVIAAPREEFNTFDAVRWSYRAREIWDNRREVATLAEAVADCQCVAGTSGKEGLYRSVTRTPREWAPDFLQAAANGPVALVMGTEDNGLSNDDVALCTQLIRIPSSEDYPSLNLSHALMVCAYELFVSAGVYEPPVDPVPAAPSELRERMFAQWREALLKIGFMEEPKANHMMMAIRRILSRGHLSAIDAKIMLGVARQTSWYANQHRPAAEADE